MFFQYKIIAAPRAGMTRRRPLPRRRRIGMAFADKRTQR
ncbi:hypothetical protein DWUX_1433 [Desulfovibrio diazotrophicus]|nr:hypothetical protein DWUX_1433 [Desulfovibrio diazotrophicus]